MSFKNFRDLNPMFYRMHRKKHKAGPDGWVVIDKFETGDVWYRIVMTTDELFGIQYFLPEQNRYVNLIVNGRHTFQSNLHAVRQQLRAIRSKTKV